MDIKLIDSMPLKNYLEKIIYIYKINICNIYSFLFLMPIIVNRPNSMLLLTILLNNFVTRLSKSDQFGDCDSSVSCKCFT